MGAAMDSGSVSDLADFTDDWTVSALATIYQESEI
jgi:hypothetical protein